MPSIISLSLSEKLLSDLNDVQEDYGFSGRSDAIRAGIRLLMDERSKLSALKGEVNALLAVAHEHQVAKISTIMHEYQPLIHSQLHTHLVKGRCLEVYVIKGNGKKIESMMKKIKKEGALSSNLIIL